MITNTSPHHRHLHPHHWLYNSCCNSITPPVPVRIRSWRRLEGRASSVRRLCSSTTRRSAVRRPYTSGALSPVSRPSRSGGVQRLWYGIRECQGVSITPVLITMLVSMDINQYFLVPHQIFTPRANGNANDKAKIYASLSGLIVARW